jgi:uncharacterized membrane protein YbhN (UPF0104 family)
VTDAQQPVTMTPPSGNNSRFSRLLAVPTTAIFAVSLVVAVVLLAATGALSGVIDAMRGADLGLLAVAGLIYLGSLWILAWRWHLLVRMARGSSNLPRAAEAFLTSVIINYAAPIGLAVPSRAALTKRALGLNASQTGIIALWEIAVDVLVLGAGTAIWMVIEDGALDDVWAEIAASSTAYLAAGVALLALLAAVAAIAWHRPSLREKLLSIGAKILIAPTRRPIAAAFTLAVTIAYWLLQGLVLWMLVTALGVTVSASFMLGFTALPILVGMLSPIPGGAAVREGLMYVVARLSGFSAEADAILAAALIYRFALFIAIPILFGLNRLWLSRQDAGSVDATLPVEDERNAAG